MGGGGLRIGCGAAVCVQFPFLCSARICVVAAVEEELNNQVCVCVCAPSCVWVEYGCCLLHYHRSLPLPPHLLLLQLRQRERGEEEGVRGKKGREGGGNEWITEWIVLCVRPCLCFVGLGYASVLYSDYPVCRPTCVFLELLFQRASLWWAPFWFFYIVRVSLCFHCIAAGLLAF